LTTDTTAAPVADADIAEVTEERAALRRVAARWLHTAHRHGSRQLDPTDMEAELHELGIDIEPELNAAGLICNDCDDNLDEETR
jgi:hypothetical protein